MIDVQVLETCGWLPALHGMRNPLDSWDKGDSSYARVQWIDHAASDINILGPNDESLMRRLIGAGSNDHCKFRRMLTIYVDINAPLYWWKEFDTYKVGTVANSCSTMHTIMNHEFTLDMFSTDQLYPAAILQLRDTIRLLNNNREMYLGHKEKTFWYEIIQLLPSSWMQKRTVMLNYEVMANIYRARKDHKLKEWHDFIDAIVAGVPYPWIFTGEAA